MDSAGVLPETHAPQAIVWIFKVGVPSVACTADEGSSARAYVPSTHQSRNTGTSTNHMM